MSYPNNKRERFLIGKRKGHKRVSLWFNSDYLYPDREKDRERFARNHRDTTKICSAVGCCGNPRRRGELTLQEMKFLSSLKD